MSWIDSRTYAAVVVTEKIRWAQDRILSILNSKHPRSSQVLRSIVGLVAVKVIAVVTNFFLVPITLTYLNPSRFGVWTTLTAVLGWVSILDIGLGSGLRNKLAEAVANSDFVRARMLVSTTYAYVGAIALIGGCILLVVNTQIDWTVVLNAPSELKSELRHVSALLIIAFCISLPTNLIITILTAIQKPALGGLVAAGVNALSLAGLAYIKDHSAGSLFNVAIVVAVSMVVAPVLLSAYVFNWPYRELRPSYRAFDRIEGSTIVGSGIQFFILQVGVVIAFSSVNLIISQLYGPAEVTPYNIAMKYFGAAGMVFTILLTPFWSAYTDAYARNDHQWISNSLRHLKRVWILFLFCIIIMVAMSKIVYMLWIGTSVEVPLILSISVALYFLGTSWCNIFVNVTNGTGKIRLQLWAAGFMCLAVLPVSLGMRAAGFVGGASVSTGVVLCLLPWCFVWPVQVRKILNGTATGIWSL